MVEAVKGIEYDIEVNGDVDYFAKALLAITNVKCMRDSGIMEVKTLQGTDRLIVTTLEEKQEEVEEFLSQFGKMEKSDIDIYELTDFDLEEGVKLPIGNSSSYFVSIED